MATKKKEDHAMATKKTTKKTTKARKPAPKSDLVTFALRLPKVERDAYAKRAGSGKSSSVARKLMAAYAKSNLAAFKQLISGAK